MSIRTRRLSQTVALQGLYSISSRHPEDRDGVTVSIDDIISYSRDAGCEFEEDYVRKIMDGVIQNQEVIIQAIEPHLAHGWTLDRIGKVVQIILFLATYEILYSESKNSTIINDYLEIAKSFNHRGEVGFINSVLDKVAKSVITSVTEEV
jgi:N utilization substance protein B